ncbi:ABC transporter permease, partial [Bacillus thuringiensis]
LFMSDNEAYILSGDAYFTLFSQFEPSFNRKSITLSSTNTILQVKGYEQAGAIPSDFSYQTLILPDAVVNNLPSTTKHVAAYNYNVQNWEKTYEIADDFMKRIQRDRQEFQYEGPL